MELMILMDGVIPRITYGDEFGNTTIGFIGYQLPIL